MKNERAYECIYILQLCKPLARGSDRHGEDGDDAEEGLRTELDGDKSVLLGLPVGGGGGLESGAVVLRDDAGNRVLEGLGETRELLDACLDDLLAPLVNFLLLVHDVL